MKKKFIISSNMNNIMLIMIFLLVFYAPKVANRDYIGILTVYVIVIFLSFFSKIEHEKTGQLIILHTFTIIIFDLINMLRYTSSSPLSIFRIFFYALIPLVSYIIGKIFSKEVDYNYFNKIVVLVGVLQAIFGILQVYSDRFRIITLSKYANFEKYNYGFENWKVGRIVGTVGNPNTYGVFMVVIIMFLLNIMLPNYKAKKHKVIIMFLSALSTYSIILTQSRTSYILLAIGICMSIILYNRKKLKKIIILFSTGLFAITLFLNIPFLSRRFSIEGLLSFGKRVPIWSKYIKDFLNPADFSLLIGYGTDYIRGVNKSVDNYYLQILLQYGMLGLISYLIMIATVFKSFYNISNKRVKNFLIISSLIILISNFLGTVNFHVDIITFMYIIFGYYCNNTNKFDMN